MKDRETRAGAPYADVGGAAALPSRQPSDEPLRLERHLGGGLNGRGDRHEEAADHLCSLGRLPLLLFEAPDDRGLTAIPGTIGQPVSQRSLLLKGWSGRSRPTFPPPSWSHSTLTPIVSAT